MTQAQIIKGWIESTENTIRSLEEWKAKLEQWDQSGCNNGDLQAALLNLRGQGLEDWVDGNPAGLDALVEAVTGTERLAQEDLGSTDPHQDGDMLPKSGDGNPTSRPRGAWVELKTINNCGPYAYLRWREGGRCRSKYLGKVEKPSPA